MHRHTSRLLLLRGAELNKPSPSAEVTFCVNTSIPYYCSSNKTQTGLIAWKARPSVWSYTVQRERRGSTSLTRYNDRSASNHQCDELSQNIDAWHCVKTGCHLTCAQDSVCSDTRVKPHQPVDHGVRPNTFVISRCRSNTTLPVYTVYGFVFEIAPIESKGYNVDVPYIKDDIYDPTK